MRFIERTIAIIFLVSGCQPSANETAQNATRLKAQRIYTEAIAVHDEVMPRMDEIMRLRQQLTAKTDSLQHIDSATHASTITELKERIRDLEQADEAMMQWMRTIQVVPTNDQSQGQTEGEEVLLDTDLIQIQETQKEAIVEIKQLMDSSIQTAESMLGLL